jgi:hypothetical protein
MNMTARWRGRPHSAFHPGLDGRTAILGRNTTVRALLAAAILLMLTGCYVAPAPGYYGGGYGRYYGGGYGRYYGGGYGWHHRYPRYYGW